MIQLFLFLLITFPTFAGSNFNKVLIVVFENTDFNDAVRQQYFSSLMREGAIATNYHALTHPSQGNYIAMISGSMFGVRNDKNIDLNQHHIGDLLEANGKTWKAYAEGYPGNCFLGPTDGKYARKHVPFISFVNIQNNPHRCANIQNTDAFIKDFSSGTLPDYSLYVPNLDNDGHNTGVAYGDKWLKQYFGPLLHSGRMPKDLLVIITFDEGSRTPDNRIYTLFWGPHVMPGAVTNRPYNHYNMLRTIEDELRLGTLGQFDQQAASINDIWASSRIRN